MNATRTSSPRLTANILATLPWPRPVPVLRPDCLRLLPSTPPPPLWKKWLKRAAAAAALGAVASALGLWVAVRHFEAGLPGVTDLRAYHAPQITRVLARDG